MTQVLGRGVPTSRPRHVPGVRQVLTGLGAVAATGAILGGGLFAYGHASLGDFRLREFTAPVLPAGAEPIRVLHLSDLHLSPDQTHKRRWVSRLVALEPDLVVNTGDNLSHPMAVRSVLETYGELLERPGVFVFGSNDYHAPRPRNPLRYLTGRKRAPRPPQLLPWQSLRDGFLTAGWHDLTHQRAQIEINGLRLEFRGTDDAHMELDDYSRVAGPAAPSTQLSIGVTHAPYLRLLDAMTADGCELLLAGHTHGGQVCLPGGRAIITNCDIEPERVKGLSQHSFAGRTAHLHVSAGLGNSPYAPYRLWCPPEATLLTLTA